MRIAAAGQRPSLAHPHRGGCGSIGRRSGLSEPSSEVIASDPLAASILQFWFGAPGSAEFGQPRPEWFRKDPLFDRRIADRFGAAIERALAGEFADWIERPPEALALLLLLDQFTRNAFRD